MTNRASFNYRKARRQRVLEKMSKMRAAKERLRMQRALDNPGQVVLQVLVTRPTGVKEAIVFDTDSDREARSKIREVMKL